MIKFLLVSGAASVIQLTLVNVLYFVVSRESYIPFLISNLAANVYAYIANRKRTFKSEAPWWNFAIYLLVLSGLIAFSTWMQKEVAQYIAQTKLQIFAPTIAAACAGFIQMLVLFPIEKFVLLKENKNSEEKENKNSAKKD